MLPLPEWPPADDIFFVRAAQTYNAWKNYGVDDNFAIAMLTMAEMESAFKAEIVGDHESAFNFYQWHWTPRGEDILCGTGVDVRTERSIAKIVLAAWWELNHTEAQALDAIEAATDLNGATAAATQFFEGAGAADAIERRQLAASRWSNWLVGHQTFLAAHPA